MSGGGNHGRRLLALATGLVLASAACGGGGQAVNTKEGKDKSSSDESSPATVRMVLYAPSIYDWGFLAAKDQGFFEEEGIRIADKPLIVETDADANRAMISNEGDIALATVGMLQAIEPGTEPAVKFIGGTGKAAYSFVGKKGSSGFEAFEGATVALSPEGQPSGVVAVTEINEIVGEGDWTPLHLGGGSGARLSALESGRAQAAFMAAPYDDMVVAQDPGLQVIDYLDAHGASYQIGAIMANRTWLEENRDVAVRWLRAYIRGSQWLYDPANREEAVRVLAQAVDAKPEMINETYDVYIAGDLRDTTPPKDGRLDREALVNVAELLQERGSLRGSVDQLVDDLVDDSVWRKARKG